MMEFETIKWIGGVDGYLELIDQRKLPGEYVKLKCTMIEQVYDAIKTLAVRGAPAIGVAGAYGVVLGLQRLSKNDGMEEAMEVLNRYCEYLGSSRPTAINLFWALDRMKKKAADFVRINPNADVVSLHGVLLKEADSIYYEDVDMCERIGKNGEKFIKDGDAVLTHCNAGSLATAGEGTALAVMFEAHKKGKRFKVYADETRPLLQGARLTAWELQQAGMDVTVICDNMAGWLMKQGKINLVITGADRIAANGDTANKIGTYSLSLLAKCHGVPFYVAAPSSTFDLNIKDGGAIPIEQRDAAEVEHFGGSKIVPSGIKIYNPAFDVTNAGDITAIITERGVIEKPDAQKIREHFK